MPYARTQNLQPIMKEVYPPKKRRSKYALPNGKTQKREVPSFGTKWGAREIDNR